MLYRITDGTLSAGGIRLLSHFDFEVKGHEKIAIVGKNGAGKSTLLRLIAGEISPDRDDKRKAPVIYTARSVTIGLLAQDLFQGTEQTVSDLIMASCPAPDPWSRDRFDYEQRYDRLLTAFGFDKADKERQLREFSGGQQTRIALIRLLLLQPDILLLDEPTNHLDAEAVRWLELYLKNYPGAVIVVSHDRFFLDEMTQVVSEIAGGKLTRYAGNYTAYRQEKLKRLRIREKAWARQQEEIAREEALIRKFKGKPRKASFARSRKKMLERMEKIEKPEAEDCHIFTGSIDPEQPGPKWVLQAEKLKIGYEKDKPLTGEMSLRIRRGQKIAVIGPNGAGKTTFLKTAAGLLPALAGRFEMGQNVFYACFDQHSGQIDSEDSVLDHFKKHFPALTEKDARHELAAYLFRGKDVCKQVKDLSGGEKARLVMAELLNERPNLMLLDEPTNHMDIAAKETLESAFKAYTGTLLFVSHDRYFIDQVADALLIFEDGQAHWYPFSYRHYLAQKEKAESSGMSISAMVSARDQALVADLKNVPKGSSLLGHALTVQQETDDWQLRLAGEAMQEAAEKVYALQSVYNVQNTKQLENFLTDIGHANPYDTPETDRLRAELDEAAAKWQQAILDWYDIWAEIVGENEEMFDNNQTFSGIE